MMNEDLVKRIIQRLLAEPEFQQYLNGQTFSGAKPSCLVLLNYIPDLQALLSQLQQRWGSEYTLSILPSPSISPDEFSLPEGMNWVTPEEAHRRSDWEKIALPSCSANTLAKIALGIRDNALTERVACGINQGISVELFTEYLGFSNKTPPAYRRVYEEYLGKVEEYGVKVYASIRERALTTKAHLTPALPKEGSTHGGLGRSMTVKEGSGVIWFSKKLLANNDVFDFPNGSRVMITKTTVVSPLARDTLKTRRIELCRDTEENS